MTKLLFFLVLFSVSAAYAQTADEYLRIAIAKIDAERPKDALAAIQRAVELKPDNVELRLYHASILFANDSPYAGHQELHNILAIDSTESEAYNLIGVYHLGMNEPDSAQYYYTKAIQHAPTDSAATSYYVNRATAKSVFRQFDEAIADLEQALAMEPDNIGVLNNLSLCYQEIGRVQESIPLLKRIIKLDSTFLGSYVNLGLVYSENDSLAQSAYYFDKALAIEPRDPLLLNNKGFLHYKLEEYGEALDLINKSINIFSSNSYAYRNRALVYFALDLNKEACRDLEIATLYEFKVRYGDEVERLYQEKCQD